MASREAARVEDWETVPWGSKSFSPRRGRVEVVGARERKRKSWVSSVGSRSGGGDGGREGERGGVVIFGGGG